MVMNALRQGAKSGVSKIILFGFMVMAVGGLVLMDVQGVFTSGLATNGNVASIGRDKLGIGPFDMTVRRVLARQGMDPQTAWELGLIDQILNSEISNNLMHRAASDTGIYVGDDIIAGKIAGIVAPYVDDKTTKKQALQRLLAAQGMGEDEFVRLMRAEMTNELLRAGVMMGAAVPDKAETEALYQYTYETRTLSALMMPHDKGITVDEPTDEILLPFYQAGKEKYAIPETRSLSVAVLTEAAIKDSVKLTDEELQEQYESQLDAYKVPEKRNLEQTILTERAQADAIAARLAKGESLKAAVKAETGTEDAYLGTAAFEEKGLATEVADKAFAGKTGDVIGPVQTALGWHVLVLKGIEEPRTRPFAEVKEDLRKSVMQSRLADQMFALSGKIDDAIAAGTPIEDMAKDLDMKLTTYGPLRADGSTPDAKEGITDYATDREALLQAAFEIGEGELSSVVEMKDGSFAVVRTDSVTEKSYKEFDAVKGDLAKVWIQDQREVLNKQRADKAIARLQAGEITLDKLASELGLSLTNLTLTRAEDPKEPLNNASKTLLFEPGKDQFAMAPVNNGFTVAQVKSITLPDVAKAPKEKLDQVAQNALRGGQEEMMLMYLEALRKEYSVKINRNVLEQVYGKAASTEDQPAM